MSVPEPSELVNTDLLESVSSRLDLRAPNRDALLLTAYRIEEHYRLDGKTEPFEGVCDVATGVGKTYIIAGAIEYYAALGSRNFAVIAPGKTIQRKTEQQFTAGNRRSLLSGMDVKPLVVTSENFNSAAIASGLEDDDEVKLFIFTVQALLRPEGTEVGRRTHKFQEGLGKAFYDHLVGLQDLIVFADEHHCYYGDAFSRAIRGLSPYALVGLTATPHPQTPRESIYYRYPLAAAIADELVKSPVIVGRSDDRRDTSTKLLDATLLLDLKRDALEHNKAALGGLTVNPVMLVVAKTIEDADAVGAILGDSSFAGGRYAASGDEPGSVLVVHSNSHEEALEALDRVEEPDSPVRVIVSVGMLKEGWDVKSVYVIASLRSSVSEILTEQTLGRGLRLPFGAYTGIELLDTLEIVAHEKYEELLKRSGAKINEEFIDLQTHIEMRKNMLGQDTLVVRETQVGADVDESAAGVSTAGEVVVTSFEARKQGASELGKRQAELRPREDFPALVLPRLVIRYVRSHFSLADIILDPHANPFRALGERLAIDPEQSLRRMRIGATVVTDPKTGLRRTVTHTTTVADRISSTSSQMSIDEGRRTIEDRVLGASIVSPRKGERAKLQPILDQFFEGLRSKGGARTEEMLAAYLDRIAQRLISLITDEARKLASAPSVERTIEPFVFAPVRIGRPNTSPDVAGGFEKNVGYTSWTKSLYEQNWFDSAPERALAAILDSSDAIRFWVRLLPRDLEIAWESGNYNPDFVAVETSGQHWLLEVKSDKSAADSKEVRMKQDAAQRWANHVNASPEMDGVQWQYLLARENDIAAAKGSWAALKGLGR